MPLNRKRIDLDAHFNLDEVRPLLIWPHEVWKQHGIPIGLQNRLDEAGILPVYKLGSRSVLYRADVEHLVASLPRRQGDAADAAAIVVAELENILEVIRRVRAVRRLPQQEHTATAA
jgi:hypothetical protein